MKRTWIFMVLVGLLASGALADKIKIEKLDDLPRHTYMVKEKVVDFLKDDAAIKKLAADVKKDLLADLDTYEITDKTTLQNMYADLGTIAIIEGDWKRYLDLVNMRIDLEDKEAAKHTMAMVGRAIASAQLKGVENYDKNLDTEIRSMLANMPYEVVEANVKSQKGSAEMVSEALVIGSIDANLQPLLDNTGGEISQDIANGLLGPYFTLRYYIPKKEIFVAALTDYINAHNVVKPDIWAERNFSLDKGKDYKPVTLCVWDSGVDTNIFVPLGQMWTNKNEKLDGKDDDKDGFVDDVHGIAWSLHSDKETGLLYPIGSENMIADEDQMRAWMKGLGDMQSSIESEEATALKKHMSTLAQDQVQPFFEAIGLYGNYCHGTHVAGIAAAGNPYARLMAARITFDFHFIPELPTVEQATKDAAALVETIDYMKKNGVRAVNMSWGGNLRSIEEALETHNAGGTPEERKELARKIYTIGDTAFKNAIKNAPEILFITSAGNSNADVKFEEFYPSSYDLPNIISIGAVDQAGEETSFTSFGKVDVYANGFEVLSYVPGGTKMKLNGTSMSSPQVLNLAGKLLAVKPDLTTKQLRELIINGADKQMAGDREVKLMNPKKSLALLEKM
ncbi:MAG: S8 family serine peptidase [Calditrichaeota bacterium]|nr:S8 family serine peptidase [Calditrichota bacterium]MCB9368963.1 S8 family serine peptidase [Calditrichota bacterium]